MHDKNGKPLKEGDTVIVEGTLSICSASAEFCNVTVQIGDRSQPHGAFNIYGTVTLNAKQVEKVEKEVG